MVCHCNAYVIYGEACTFHGLDDGVEQADANWGQQQLI